MQVFFAKQKTEVEQEGGSMHFVNKYDSAMVQSSTMPVAFSVHVSSLARRTPVFGIVANRESIMLTYVLLAACDT
jgi:hypothetical protein